VVEQYVTKKVLHELKKQIDVKAEAEI